ncbi:MULTISPECIES: hypothetical protein [Pseudoalteromonas]|nr:MULTISPECIES: hypothetical protein [Pseudoalteromonas]MBB1332098.1 hypothetical protein [Pseudoalteromonas sp. SR41-6]MBB1457356.1 hypothetical protein [Pseudoalteromonas sp. SG41-8]MBB1478735.1 hypothetical protein [Pseudoalteromonas sp. SG41-2]|tara:strand:+ start:595 stop:939 length:345 start_codon:yes stop_codon:yes gene_type:complete
MNKVTRIESGKYSVSDGRFIVKSGSSWYVLQEDGNNDFGPLPTLSIAKEYVTTGTIESKEPNRSTQHTRRQSRKAFHAHIAAESKNGNQGPLIIYIIIALLMFIVGIAIEVNKT